MTHPTRSLGRILTEARPAAAFLAALAAVAWPASPARAGESAIGWLEASPIAGSLGVVWKRTDAVWLGLAGGGGIPQIDQTLTPEKRDFLRIIHVGGVARLEPSRSFHVDLGPQVGIGELENDPYSGDDLPNLFAGFAAAAMYGGRRWRIGPRLDLVWIFDERVASIFVANVTPLAVRVEW